jgi:hypothetical protein
MFGWKLVRNECNSSQEENQVHKPAKWPTLKLPILSIDQMQGSAYRVMCVCSVKKKQMFCAQR